MPALDWIGKQAVVRYAAACRFGANRLMRDRITFKQTPCALEL